METHSPLWLAGSIAVVVATAAATWRIQQWLDRKSRDRASTTMTAPPIEVAPEQVERMESWVLERPEEVARIVAELCPRRPTVAVTTTVYGASGSGKTTLATLVCADPAVRQRFGAGVHRVTLGPDMSEGALVQRVNDLIRQIDPDPDQHVAYTDVGPAGEHLATLLSAGPPRLLVLDEVCSDAQLSAFPLGGLSARLVTTPTTSVATDTMAVELGVLPVRQARALLTADLPTLPGLVIDGLTREAGRWPLLLRLVNRILADHARLRDDVTPAAEALLLQLRRSSNATRPDTGPTSAVAHRSDDDDLTRRRRALTVLMEAAAALVSPADRQRLTDLAVFGGPDPVPVSAVATLWRATADIDAPAAGALCARLADLALVSLARTADGGSVTMHDEVRRCLGEQLGAAGVTKLHQLMLDTVAASLPTTAGPGGDGTMPAWWQLPASATYLSDHLVAHLLAAGRASDAEAVATDLRWVTARLDSRGPVAPFADLTLIDTPTCVRLRRLLSRTAHLLAPTEPAHSLVDILHSRVDHDPDWGPQARQLAGRRASPGLTNRWPLPDLPHQALLRTLAGHTGAVTAVAVSADGGWLATASEDKTVRTWDAGTGRRRAVLTGHTGAVNAVAIWDNGSRLATAGDDRTVRIWDADTGRQRAVLTGHTDEVYAVAISRSGSWLASAGWDRTVRIWDAATGRQRAVLTAHTGPVTAVTISADGTWLATASGDRTVRIWDVAARTVIQTIKGHTDWVRAIAISADGTWLATASDDETVRLSEVATGERRAFLNGHLGPVNAVAIGADGTWLATGGTDRTVRIWDADTGWERTVLTGHTGPVRTVATWGDGGRLVTAGDDATVRLWDPASCADADPVADAIDRVTPVNAVAVSADGTWLATACPDKTVRLWDAATGWQRTALTSPTNWVGAVAISADGTWLAGGGGDRTVRIWDAATGRQRAVLKAHRDEVHAVAISPDDTWLATAGGDRSIRIWDPATGRQRSALDGHTDTVYAVTISADGSWLATAGRDGTVRIWDAATGATRHTLTGYTGHDGPVNDVSISADGTWLATASDDGTVRMWDPATGRRRRTLTGHTGWVGAVAISPDGDRLASVGGDRTVRIWNLANGELQATMRLEHAARTCAWSPCGRHLAVGGVGGLFYFTANGPA